LKLTPSTGRGVCEAQATSNAAVHAVSQPDSLRLFMLPPMKPGQMLAISRRACDGPAVISA
jgi:hypothetical protein